MKLIDAIKYRGRPFEIPDCSRNDLPEFFKQLGFRVGAEIGVSFGENLVRYCQAGLTMYGVDPWRDYDGFTYRPMTHLTKQNLLNKSIDGVYQMAVDHVKPFPNCKLIRKTSMEALADFPRKSLDFVYIDGNHDFGYVAMDLMKWADKVKKGGIIAGHDYWPVRPSRMLRQVKLVVDAFIQGYDIDHWYLLGLKKPVAGFKTDDTLSFMFFKHW